jgi:hypothetical protein
MALRLVDTRGAAGRIAQTSSLALAIVAVLAAATLANTRAIAQDRIELNVPQRLHYLFDLPWCAKWLFTCHVLCKKVGDRIQCEEGRAKCDPSFEQFECREFSVRESCERWSDGCNTCARVSGETYCTAMGCRPYVPSFACLKEAEK